ncbi:MAG TPA: molybdenum cofactor biosynthesis protein MoaE [Candidatus Polarisedimenticolia bacterium]
MTENADLIFITPDPLDEAALAAAVRRDSSGAIASFVGVVRDEHRGRRVHHLVYEAYPSMAEQEMRRIVSVIHDKWEVTAVALAHRTGRLEIGEASVVVAVAAPHRKEALEACAFAIEQVKQSVPIWKKEYSDEGEEWIIGDPSHR